MGMFTESKNTIDDEWREHLSRQPAVTVQYLQFKNHGLGSTPLESCQHFMMATSHPSHRSYSEIETTKRKERWTQIKKPAVEHLNNNCGFVYPCRHWDNFVPNGRAFSRFPKICNPFKKVRL